MGSRFYADPHTKRQEAATKARSKVRARVEHVFGNQHNGTGSKFIRTIGILRATARIGMHNLATTCAASSCSNATQGRPDKARSGLFWAPAVRISP